MGARTLPREFRRARIALGGGRVATRRALHVLVAAVARHARQGDGVGEGLRVTLARQKARPLVQDSDVCPRLMETNKERGEKENHTAVGDRKSTRLNSSHSGESRMPSSA